MCTETISEIEQKIRGIEHRLRAFGFEQTPEHTQGDDSDSEEIADLYEERERLMQQLSQAAHCVAKGIG